MIRIALAVFALVLIGGGYYLYDKNRDLPDASKRIERPSAKTQEAESPPVASAPPVEAVAQTPGPEKKIVPFKGHFEMSIPVRQSAVDQSAARKIRGNAREEQFWGIFRESGSDLSRFVKVHSIKCRGTVCTVDAESIDNDPDHFQGAIYGILNEYPWVGNKIDVTVTDENPLRAKMVFYQEIPK